MSNNAYNLKIVLFQASSDGNATVSILSYRPKKDHIGKSLVCKATNPLITQSDLFDNMDLSIDCKWPKSHGIYYSGREWPNFSLRNAASNFKKGVVQRDKGGHPFSA